MEDLKMEVMWKDSVSAVVTVHDNQVSTRYFTNDPVKYFLPKVPMDLYLLQTLLETRCYPRNRHNIDDILRHFGLDNYDPLAMCRITHGLMRNDYLWLRFDDEPVSYDDIRIREG